ncbi:hypothetical protein DRQ50_10615, partial [bacterium]
MIAITVRDIADGSPVPDLPFLIRGLVEPLRTDEQGVLHLRPGNLATLRPKGDDWSILRPANSVDPQEQETVWLHRYLRILGSICVDSELVELDPSRVRISVVAVGEDGTAGVVAREGLDTTWFLLHSLRRIKNVCKVAEDGSFEATIPRIPGFAISAAMPGWQPDQVPVPIKSDPCVVRLTLSKETLVLTGTVKSADGEPLAGVSVCGFV